MRLAGYTVRTEGAQARRQRQLASGVLSRENCGVDVAPKDGDGREHAYRLRKDATA